MNLENGQVKWSDTSYNDAKKEVAVNVIQVKDFDGNIHNLVLAWKGTHYESGSSAVSIVELKNAE